MKLKFHKLITLVLLSFLGSFSSAQCPFTFSFFGSGTAPTLGNTEVMETCSFIGEAVTTTNVVSGNSYCVEYTYSGFPSIFPYVVVYDSGFNPIAFGTSPVSFTAPSNGTYYSIPFADAFCTDFDPNFGCNVSTWTNGGGGVTSSTQIESACVEYTWPFNNQTYTSSGFYTDSIVGTCGTAILNLDLTIVPNTLDYSVTNTNGTLTSNQTTGTYQWIDCQTDSIIAGATNQSFTPTQPGYYAVIISDSTCFDTTNCFSVGTNILDTVVSCGSYTWPFNNLVYTASGVYVDSISSPAGYDYGYLDLTILAFAPSNLSVVNSNGILTSQFSQTSATYQWIDCSLGLIIPGATNQSFTPGQTGSYAVIIADGSCSDTSACETVFVPIVESASGCDDYTWSFNNQTYTNSGVYTDSVPLLGGYQVATLNLTIGIDPSNLQVVDSAGVLYSFSTLGNYQWIDCATNLPINGANNQSFSPLVTGSYAVIVSDGVCSDTSACTTVLVSGLNAISNLTLTITPNPTHNHVVITFEGELVQLNITDANGKRMYSKPIQSGEQVDLSSFPAGVYLFNFQSSEYNEVHRVVRH